MVPYIPPYYQHNISLIPEYSPLNTDASSGRGLVFLTRNDFFPIAGLSMALRTEKIPDGNAAYDFRSLVVAPGVDAGKKALQRKSNYKTDRTATFERNIISLDILATSITYAH